LRLILGLTIIWALGLTGNGFLILIGILAGAYIILTAALGYDQIYTILGINTRENTDDTESTP
jgi:hypothetical protein